MVQTDPEVNKWTHAVVSRTPTSTQPRSYTIETENGAQLRRNRCYIKPEASENVRERPRRNVSRPQRLIETLYLYYITFVFFFLQREMLQYSILLLRFANCSVIVNKLVIVMYISLSCYVVRFIVLLL